MDDIQLASSDMSIMHETKRFLYKNFDIKDLGERSYVFGIDIHRNKSQGVLCLSQRAYIDKVLKKIYMQNCSLSIDHVVKVTNIA